MSYEPKQSVTEELMRCRVWIENALAYSGGTHNFDDICLGVLSGNLQLWPTENSCMVTEVVVYPRKKVFHVFLAGGTLQELIDFHEPAIEWAKAQGCSGMTLSGRFGWEKALASSGWSKKFTMLEREI